MSTNIEMTTLSESRILDFNFSMPIVVPQMPRCQILQVSVYNFNSIYYPHNMIRIDAAYDEA